MLFATDAAITTLLTHPASEPHHPTKRFLQRNLLHGSKGSQGSISATVPGTGGHS